MNEFESLMSYIYAKESLRNTKWLITGSTGIIGSYLISFLGWLNEKELDRSITITAIHRSNLNEYSRSIYHLLDKSYIDFRQIDLSKDFIINELSDYDFIVHGASNAAPKSYLEDPIGTINTNVKATQLMLDHLSNKRSASSFIYISSGEIYGSPEISNVPTPEYYHGTTDHMNERSCYVESKRFAETLCWNYYKKHNLNIKILRPVHVYGPGFKKNDSRVWADFITKAHNGEDIEILGDGTDSRGFCYIADALSQMLAVLQRGKAGDAYNIGNSNETSIKRLAELIAVLSGRDIKIIIKNEKPNYLKSSPRISCISVNKVKKLAPTLETPLETGIKNTMEWYNAYVSKI